ncbi:MAG: hypothetical protein MZV70_70735 [Desulfobacterales bacterium]|nr:hypothetical protein [Desulfobacterales bacterium]
MLTVVGEEHSILPGRGLHRQRLFGLQRTGTTAGRPSTPARPWSSTPRTCRNGITVRVGRRRARAAPG